VARFLTSCLPSSLSAPLVPAIVASSSRTASFTASFKDDVSVDLVGAVSLRAWVIHFLSWASDNGDCDEDEDAEDAASKERNAWAAQVAERSRDAWRT
jgi:hypothetical protein